MNVKLCMMVVLTELYPFIPLSLTLVIFKRGRLGCKCLQRALYLSIETHIIEISYIIIYMPL